MADDDSLRYTRQVEVLWRVAPDRVLVRRPWPRTGQDEAADLLGMAALIWIALDEPGTAADIVDRLADVVDDVGSNSDPAELADHVADGLAQLVDAGWINAMVSGTFPN